MAAPARQLHLNAFLRNIGQHEAAWRLPETQLSGITDIDHYIELAHIAERGKLDTIFFADHPVLKDKTEFRPFDALDPVTLVTALSGATNRIGLIATASTTYSDPYSLARRFATLDHVSRALLTFPPASRRKLPRVPSDTPGVCVCSRGWVDPLT